MKIYFFMIAGLIGFFSSCSPKLTPFTEDLNNSYDWSESELQKIQFYLSNDIVLYREKGNEHSVIEEGQIKIEEGRDVEKIVFKKGTPGVLLFTPKSDRFAVSFDDGEDRDKFLMFGPSEKANGRFVLLAKKWNRKRGKVSYNNKVYYTPSESAFASLMVDLKSAKKSTYHSEQAKGRKIN